MKKALLLLIFIFIVKAGVFAQLTFVVSQLPPNTSDRVDLYLAGTFNNWAPGNEEYNLKKNSDGFFAITINPVKGSHQFKFTRGNWTTVEGDINGAFRPDRIVNYSGKKQTVYLNILAWEGNAGNTKSTANTNVMILDPAFEIPQLDKTRKIWIYLPSDYYQSDKSYPVLYLQDGQNLFDESTSFSGEWKIDESLSEIEKQTGKGFIAVGIENGGSDRMSEYSHAPNSKYGGGQGDAYVRFIAETLKPFIDEKFRTLQGPQNTAIMGSSMGGLISMYAVAEYPEVFGKAGVFSPSFWYTEGQSFWHVIEEGKKKNVKIYMVCGANEGQGMTGDMIAMKRTLLNIGFQEKEVFHKIHTDGQHKEWYWAREFPEALYWLFEDQIKATSKNIQVSPTIDPIHIQALSEKEYEMAYKTIIEKPKYSLVDEKGMIISKPKKLKVVASSNDNGLRVGTFKIKAPKKEDFYLLIFDDEQLLVVKKF